MNEMTHREAFGHDHRRSAPTIIIDKLHSYANIKLTREDSTPTRCATFEAMDYACGKIARIEKLSPTKIYPALRWIGYNRRYADMKSDNPDALWDMGEICGRCLDSNDQGVIPFVRSSHGLFTNKMDVVQYRIASSAHESAMKDAVHGGLKLSELNLFNALTGLEMLVSEEPTYYLLRQNLDIDDSLTTFVSIKKRMIAKRTTLLKLLGD